MTKQTKWHVHPAKTQISLSICQVWSESLLSAWRKLGSLATIERTAKTLIRLGECPGWPESSLGAKVILLVLSWGGSFNHIQFIRIEESPWHLYPISGYFDQKMRKNLFSVWTYHLQKASLQFRSDLARTEVRSTYGPYHAKMWLMAYANNKGADQPAHPHLCCSLLSMKCILAISKVSRF